MPRPPAAGLYELQGAAGPAAQAIAAVAWSIAASSSSVGALQGAGAGVGAAAAAAGCNAPGSVGSSSLHAGVGSAPRPHIEPPVWVGGVLPSSCLLLMGLAGACLWSLSWGLQASQAAGPGRLGAVTHRERARQAGQVLLQVRQRRPIPHKAEVRPAGQLNQPVLEHCQVLLCTTQVASVRHCRASKLVVTVTGCLHVPGRTGPCCGASLSISAAKSCDEHASPW